MLLFGKINFFANTFITIKDREKRETPSYSSSQDASKHMHIEHERSIWKFGLTSGQMTWPCKLPRWVILHISRCVLTRQTHTVPLHPRLYLDCVRSYWRKWFRDLRWRHTWWRHMACTGVHLPAVALDSLLYAFESSRIARCVMDVEKQLKRFTARNISIKWAVTWPWQQGNSSATKCHRSLPLGDFI